MFAAGDVTIEGIAGGSSQHAVDLAQIALGNHGITPAAQGATNNLPSRDDSGISLA